MSDNLYIGVMTGTSMDGIDAVAANIDQHITPLSFHSNPIPDELRAQLLSLCASGLNEIERSCEADVQLGVEIARTVNQLLEHNDLAPQRIRAIGSHGQTIRHSTLPGRQFSLQIGNPSVIAEHTGITTIANFRMADIAAGGQGAPLAPAFHEAAFASPDITRLVINLGGIANITRLEPNATTLGFDTGPANTLMDQWIKHCKKEDFDRDGQWAESGKVIETLLDLMLKEPFFSLPAPKSTGRELFNLSWLEPQLKKLQPYQDEDVQRTLLELSATTIANEVRKTAPTACDIHLCGGGVFNTFFISRLKALLPGYSLNQTDALGIHSQQVEALAFAWLAQRTIAGLHGNLPAVTGAKKPKILGGIYPAS